MFWKKLLEPQISVDRSGSAVHVTQCHEWNGSYLLNYS